MQKLLAFSLALTVSLFFLTPAQACEPCFKILTLEETAAQADLIIIGEKTREGPSTGDYPHGGPDWIEIKISETLKGEVEGKKIKVNSWDGMCAYGIIITDKRDYLIFLAEGEDYYRAVEIGCSVRQFPIEDGMVEMDEESVPLDELVESLKLERVVVEEKGDGMLPVCGSLGVGVILLGLAWMGKKKDYFNKII